MEVEKKLSDRQQRLESFLEAVKAARQLQDDM